MICLRAVLVAVAMAAAPSALRALAAEPERFTPAPDAVGMQPPQAELGLQSILTQSYLQVSDGPLEPGPEAAALPVETLPAPAAAPLPADSSGVPAG
ncbi:MAG: hypothetical protein ACKOHK_10995, partial [Planctomycetia bacterium]